MFLFIRSVAALTWITKWLKRGPRRASLIKVSLHDDTSFATRRLCGTCRALRTDSPKRHRVCALVESLGENVPPAPHRICLSTSGFGDTQHEVRIRFRFQLCIASMFHSFSTFRRRLWAHLIPTIDTSEEMLLLARFCISELRAS